MAKQNSLNSQHGASGHWRSLSDDTEAAFVRYQAVTKPAGYSLTQIMLHWTIAALVAVQFLFHDAMEDAFDDIIDADRVRGDELAGAWLHAGVGMTILGLSVIRLIIRLRQGAPPAHRDKPAFLIWIASATHVGLYGFILAMPIVGAAAWFGMIEEAGELHAFASQLLLALIGLHVSGALAEHFVFRNNSLKRMLIPERRSRGS